MTNRSLLHKVKRHPRKWRHFHMIPLLVGLLWLQFSVYVVAQITDCDCPFPVNFLLFMLRACKLYFCSVVVSSSALAFSMLSYVLYNIAPKWERLRAVIQVWKVKARRHHLRTCSRNIDCQPHIFLLVLYQHLEENHSLSSIFRIRTTLKS